MKKVFLIDSSAVLRSIEKRIMQLSNLEVMGESTDVRDILSISNKFIDFIFIEASKKNIIEIEKVLIKKKRISANIILLVDEKITLIQKYSGLYIWKRPDLLSCSSEKLKYIAAALNGNLEKIKTSSFFIIKNTVNKGGVSSALPDANKVVINYNYKIVMVGVSTGGPGAVLKLLSALGKNFPLPILITQHIDSSFERNLTDWLDKSLSLPVHIAEDGIVPLAGNVYFAPADYHMIICKNKRNEIIIKLTTEPPVNFLRPSVDKLFLSGAETLKSDVISVLLTGMGADGANGSCVLRKCGAYTIGEAEETCVVYGMPKAAYDMGGIVELLPLYKIADRLKNLVIREKDNG